MPMFRSARNRSVRSITTSFLRLGAAVAYLCAPLAIHAQARAASEMRPFSAAAVDVKVGAEGIGFDLATPLAKKLNLRGGASFFSYSHPLTEDGLEINPNIVFRKIAASLDVYPFGGSFRLSPGLVLHNGNRANATVMVPGGHSFDLDDSTYYSSPTDPLHGTAAVSFGHSVAPSFTLGWGNMIPRSGRHWSVPFEVGFEYIGRPALTYDFAGSACNAEGCSTVQDDPDFQANRVAEQAKLNNDLAPLRFYPIVSLGLGYRF